MTTATDTRESLSAALKTSTAEAHDKAEHSVFMDDLLAGKLSVADFIALQEQSWLFYSALEDAAQQLHHFQEPAPVAGVPRLSSVLLRSLERTCAEARAHAKTTPPLTAWKNQWLTKDARGNLVLKARQQQPRLHALVTIYQRYQDALQAAELYDFDDMIGQVIHAASTHPELAYELQETYQYIMVDEFQDTKCAFWIS